MFAECINEKIFKNKVFLTRKRKSLVLVYCLEISSSWIANFKTIIITCTTYYINHAPNTQLKKRVTKFLALNRE